MEKPQQNAWNFASLFVFFGLVLLAGLILHRQGFEIQQASVRDLIVIMLASYRLTRIVVFEKILKFIRDYVKSKERYYVLNTVRFIITCPWCAGVWITMFIIILFYLVPFGILLVYVLAISGLASFLVMLANLLGLKIEHLEKGHKPHDY